MIRARRRRLALVLPTVLATLALPAVVAAQTSAGQWRTLAEQMPVSPIHVALLRTGKVIVIGGSEYDGAGVPNRVAVWDPRTGSIAVQTVPWDQFCNGMAFLPDGRLLVAGGTKAYKPFRGAAATTIFDPVTERFVEVHGMAHGRWYPTTTALADGRVLTFSGVSDDGTTRNNAIEVYRVAEGWSPERVAPWTPPNYPRTFLLPDGRLFYARQRANLYDPATNAWTLGLPRWNHGGSRNANAAVLLPLLPDRGYAARVMVMGGDSPATASAEVIDLSAPSPTWRLLPPMSQPRIQGNGVLLPDGRVLAVGGSAVDKDAGTASLAADLFDPVTETWAPAGTIAHPRLYHSVALLLPDATVLVAGSDPTLAGAHERRLEVYSPPYLFNADGTPATRLAITAAPARVGYGQAFAVATANAADIGSVVFVRPGANTHAFDMEQRLIGLHFVAGADGLTVTAPPDGGVAPPGWYMLFVLNRAGVPSTAAFVQLSPAADDEPPRGTISLPSAPVTVKTGEAVQFAGDGTDADGAVAGFSWVFPGGSPATAAAATPSPVVFAEPGDYTVSLTVVDDRGVNDPSPPSLTVTVQPGTAPTPVLAVTPDRLAFSGPPGAVLPAQNLSITNTGGGSLTWTAAADAAWLRLDATSGTAPSTLPASADTTGLAAGQYTGAVTITATGATGSPATVPVTLDVTDAAPPPGPVLLADDFNDGDAAGWTVSPLGGASGWSVVDGALRYAGGVNTNVYAGDPGWADYTLEVRVRLTTLLNSPGGLRARVDLVTGAGYVVRLFPGNGNLKLLRSAGWKVNNTTDAQLGVAPVAYATDRFHVVRLLVSGTTIAVEFDGVRVITVTDTVRAAGAIALDGSGQPIVFDDVLVTAP